MPLLCFPFGCDSDIEWEMNKHSLTTTIELHNEVCLQQSDGSMLLQKVSAGFSVQGLWISRSRFHENIITTVLYTGCAFSEELFSSAWRRHFSLSVSKTFQLLWDVVRPSREMCYCRWVQLNLKLNIQWEVRNFFPIVFKGTCENEHWM